MNYFNYFTEIEEHFQRKRGAQILLSPVDWALIASWREAGIPLAAVLAGIDQAFEKFDSGRRRDTQRHRSLIYCAAAVLAAAEAMRTAAVGASSADAAPTRSQDDAFTHERIRAHLEQAERRLAACPHLDPDQPGVAEILTTLCRLADSLSPQPVETSQRRADWGRGARNPPEPERAAERSEAGSPRLGLEELDRVLTVLDDKLQLALLAATPVEGMVEIRAAIARDLAPYRRQLRVEQLAMIERQFLQRRLLERANLPRLSLFYMA